jgi:hypothetical protein
MKHRPVIILAIVVLFALSAAVVAQVAQTTAGIATEQRRDFTMTPPVAERAAVRLLSEPGKEGNAVLMVQFGRSERAPRTITIQLEREKAVLRDDGERPDEKAGDGIHSAFITVDAGKLKEQQEQVLRAKEIPVFVGRELMATVTPQLDERKIESLREIPPVPNRANFQELKLTDNKRLEVALQPIQPGQFIPIFPFVSPASVVPAASLLINDPAVVNDPKRTFNPCTNAGTPMGKWTFGHLMSEMATGAGLQPAAFTRKWLRKWEVDQNVNDFIVPQRGQISTVINQWPKINNQLDLAKSPFKLVAIVNRIDLRGNLIYGGGSAGEGRFVFALMDGNCNTRPFLVIFEYGIRRPSCPSVKAWGQQWQNLKNNPVGSPAYNAALEAITVQFTEAGTNQAQTPNHSSLNQLRTNEIALTSPWELREFRLSPINGHLFEDTVKQTPDITLNQTQTLADYTNANAPLIVQDKHVVPDDFAGNPFLGGAAPVVPSAGSLGKMRWDGPAPQPSATIVGPPQANLRHHLSLNTCNSCHRDETGAVFTHVSQSGSLSGFLTGITVPDPAGEGVNRSFNDLLRRQQSLAQLLNQPCFFFVFEDPLRMQH